MSSSDRPGRHATSATLLALVADALCVLAFVVIGARNHDSGGGLAVTLGIGVPFWLALVAAHVVAAAAASTARSGTTSTRNTAIVWVVTVAGGVLLRNVAFGDGTAPVFIAVTAIFLGATMSGWRAFSRRRLLS